MRDGSSEIARMIYVCAFWIGIIARVFEVSAHVDTEGLFLRPSTMYPDTAEEDV